MPTPTLARRIFVIAWRLAGILAFLLPWRISPALAASGPPVSTKQPSVLFLNGSGWITAVVDPQYKKELNAAGYAVGTAALGSLEWDTLKQFNVLVIHHLPPDVAQSGGQRGSVLFARKLPLLQRFLGAGGGVLLLHDAAEDLVLPNSLLAPLGARIINEEVTDPEHIWKQPDYLGYYFGWTRQVTPSPVTTGVQTVWYPIGYSTQDDHKTCTMAVDGSWQVIVRGEPTAYSYNGRSTSGAAGLSSPSRTYPASPPLVAIRQAGNGRLALFPSSSSFTVQAGYHVVWEQIVLDRGVGVMRSDTGKLLRNTLAWLVAPTVGSTEIGGFQQAPDPPDRPDPAPAYLPERQPAAQKQQFRGLIGIHSAYSDGMGGVEEYARAARAAHYQFIAFTEDLGRMTEEKWKEETADCKRVSDAGFLAMAGISYLDTVGNRYCCFAFPLWPRAEWMTPDRQRMQDLPGWYFGANWPPLAVVETSHNPTPPWLLKFYGALSLYTYHLPKSANAARGTIPGAWLDDGRQPYLRLTGNQYNSVPLTVHELYDPSQVAAATGYETRAWAEKIEDLPRSLHHTWYAQPQGSYVTSGPTIHSWWIENGVGGNGAPDDPARPWRLHLDVSSTAPLTDVRIMDGQRLFRRFAVSGMRFSAVLEGLHDQQRYFVLEATDRDGGQAISPTLRTAVSRHSIYMCTDMQNTLECGVMRDHRGHWTYSQMLGLYVTGWDSLGMGILAPEKEIMPEGLDYVVGGFSGGAGHYVRSAEGIETSVAARNLYFGSGDAVILDNDFGLTFGQHGDEVPTRFARTNAKFISYTMRLYSTNLLLLRRETTFLRTVKMASGPFPELQALSISLPAESFKQYAYSGAGGSPILGNRPGDNKPLLQEITIPRGGYLAFYPNFYGSVAVFPLDHAMQVSSAGSSVSFGYDLSGQTIPAGTRFKDEFLVMRGAFGNNSPQAFEAVRSLYGLAGPAAYHPQVSCGQELNHRFTLHLQSRDGSAAFRASRAILPTDLPVQVDGLQDRWTTVLVDADTMEWRPVGLVDGAAYVQLNVNKHGRSVFIGHPFTCSSEQVFLAIRPAGKEFALEVHNPLRVSAPITIHSNPHCPGLPAWQASVTAPPGSTITLHAPGGLLAGSRWLVD